MTKLLAVCCMTMFTGFTAQTSAQENQALRLVQTIPLPGVTGRLDHMGVDLQKKRLFVAASAALHSLLGPLRRVDPVHPLILDELAVMIVAVGDPVCRCRRTRRQLRTGHHFPSVLDCQRGNGLVRECGGRLQRVRIPVNLKFAIPSDEGVKSYLSAGIAFATRRPNAARRRRRCHCQADDQGRYRGGATERPPSEYDDACFCCKGAARTLRHFFSFSSLRPELFGIRSLRRLHCSPRRRNSSGRRLRHIRARHTRRTGCMLPLQLCAITLTSHKPARLNNQGNGICDHAMPIIIPALRAFVFREVGDRRVIWLARTDRGLPPMTSVRSTRSRPESYDTAVSVG
jgi:hypothetical protein